MNSDNKKRRSFVALLFVARPRHSGGVERFHRLVPERDDLRIQDGLAKVRTRHEEVRDSV